ncbi:MAG: hypothetical protein JAY94_03135 [Candidatus Thiodiazotropha endolucinida]|nr:hypothetical protein [Candidatus Thiodiazotropha taylori]MCW4316482.1 hypothetical protein [Candidatus Thiodiazotropha taylori]
MAPIKKKIKAIKALIGIKLSTINTDGPLMRVDSVISVSVALDLITIGCPGNGNIGTIFPQTSSDICVLGGIVVMLGKKTNPDLSLLYLVISFELDMILVELEDVNILSIYLNPIKFTSTFVNALLLLLYK